LVFELMRVADKSLFCGSVTIVELILSTMARACPSGMNLSLESGPFYFSTNPDLSLGAQVRSFAENG
jgi:hypothetical protein